MPRIKVGGPTIHRPAEGRDAYELALKRGFVGSIDEWIQSLHGRDGVDGNSTYEIAVRHGFEGTEAEWLKAQEPVQGPKGDRGPPGPRGPKPDHQWNDTALRFEKPDGTWGKYVDLKGDKGDKGAVGTSTEIMGGGGVVIMQGNSWFPAGW